MDDDHRHCKVCGKVTAPGQDTCGPECRARREATIAARRNYTYLMYGLIGFLLLLLVLGYIRF